MLICSVGIALALLGLFFLAYSTIVAEQEATLLLEPLIATAGQAFTGLAQCCLYFSAGRLRHQNGVGPAPYLEA